MKVRTMTITLLVLGVSAPLTLPAAAAPATIRPCSVSQLVLHKGLYGEAGGQFIQTLTFTNLGARDCRLSGWPRIEGRLSSGGFSAVRQRRVIQGRRSTPFSAVVLRPKGAASFDVYGADWDALHNRACPMTIRLRVRPPGGAGSLSVNARIPDCRSGFEIAPLIAGRSDRDSWSVAWHG